VLVAFSAVVGGTGKRVAVATDAACACSWILALFGHLLRECTTAKRIGQILNAAGHAFQAFTAQRDCSPWIRQAFKPSN